MDEQELGRISAELEKQPASAAIRWAAEEFGSDLILAASFQDCVLIDIAVGVDPGLRVMFLDTGFHFPETLEYVEAVRSRYGLNLEVLTPDADADAWPCGTEQCCRRRKVEPLQKVLVGARAWITGLRRIETPERANAAIVAPDPNRGVVKINPMAAWSDQDMAGYTADHDLLVHPLMSAGYLSIGCAPTTFPVAEGADPRSGRWAGTDKTECGLHV
ncbi:MAG: phosphoadenylyl-sulfate reductase [Acidimicrobiales bacterium]